MSPSIRAVRLTQTFRLRRESRATNRASDSSPSPEGTKFNSPGQITAPRRMQPRVGGPNLPRPSSKRGLRAARNRGRNQTGHRTECV
jgi:hypothetical protein